MGLARSLTPTTDLTEWTPVSVGMHDHDVTVSWAWSRGIRFDAPLWTETATQMMTDPFRLLFQHTGGLADLAHHAERRRAVPPAGFVYHLSRCGSTLLARVLGSLPLTHVLSEPAPLDHIMRALAHRPFAERVTATRWMLRALSPLATNADQRLIVKLDAWHIQLFPLLRRAFPDVPWIFLSRNPLEVMVSHERHAGAQLIPGAIPGELLGVDGEGLSDEEYGASVLAAMLRSALRNRADGGIFVDYAELPTAIESRIGPHFGIDVSQLDRAILAADAKKPDQPFVPDAVAKLAAARDSTREITMRIVGDAHEQFEVVRRTELAASSRPGN